MEATSPDTTNLNAEFQYRFGKVRTEVEVLITRYEYLKGLVECSCSPEELDKCLESNMFLRSAMENSRWENQKLVEDVCALQEVFERARVRDGRLVEGSEVARGESDREVLARKLEEENAKLRSLVEVLEQEKRAFQDEVSLWRQRGGELERRFELQDSQIDDIAKEVAPMRRMLETATDAPCKEIKGVLGMAMAVIAQFESSASEQVSGFQREMERVLEANASLESRCRGLEEQLEAARELEAELAELRRRCQCSARELAAAQLEQRRSLESEERVKELEAALLEERRRLAQLEAELAELRRRCQCSARELAAAQLEQRRSLESEERVKELEAALLEERRRLAQQEAELAELRRRCQCSARELAAAQLEQRRSLESEERVKELEAALLEERRRLAQQEAELAELRRRCECSARELAAAQLDQRRSLESEERVKELEAALLEERRRLAQQEAELAELRRRCECSARELAAAQLDQRRSLESEERVKELEAALLEERRRLAQQEAELAELRRRCECSARELAAAQLDQRRSLESEERVKELEAALLEERRRLAEQVAAVEENNKRLDDANNEMATMQKNNSHQVQIFEGEINKLNSRVKSMLFDLQTTKDQLGARQDELGQLLQALEKRNEVIRNLEEAQESLKIERDQHVNRIASLESKLKELNNGFAQERESMEELIDSLKESLESAEKDREQLMCANAEVADEFREMQAMIESLCAMVDQVKDFLTEQTLGKERMVAKTPRLRVLFSTRRLQSSVSTISGAREETRELRQAAGATCSSWVASTEQSRKICVCLGDDSIVASAADTVEDIKAQLKAYVRAEEARKRGDEQLALARSRETAEALRAKCEELDRNKLELKDLKNKYNSAKHKLHELKQQNTRLAGDLGIAEDTIAKMEREMNNFSCEMTILETDVKKALDTIRKQCSTILELEATIVGLKESPQSPTPQNKIVSVHTVIQQESSREVRMLKTTTGTSKEISTTEISQEGTADLSSKISKFLDEEVARYKRLISELETKIEEMKCSHAKEIEKINNSHVEIIIAMKAAFKREKSKDRKDHEELVKRQQEMHEEEIKVLNQAHESELSCLWGGGQFERECRETQTSDVLLETLDLDDPGLRNEEGLGPSRRRADDETAQFVKGLEASLAEDEADLGRKLQALREENDQKLVHLKLRYCSETRKENETFKKMASEILRTAMKALCTSKPELWYYEPYAGVQRLDEVLHDKESLRRSRSIVLDEFYSQLLRCLVHYGPEAMPQEQVSALHLLVCPTSCHGPTMTVGRRRAGSSRTMAACSRSDLSLDQSDMLDECFLRNCTAESEIELRYEMLRKRIACMNEMMVIQKTRNATSLDRSRQFRHGVSATSDATLASRCGYADSFVARAGPASDDLTCVHRTESHP